MNQDFLSCDWGTTSFRLRWVSAEDRKVVREIRENAGIKSLHEEVMRLAVKTGSAREDVFGDFLRTKLNALFAGQRPPTNPLPLVISGMASSSVGWLELPYAQTPFALDGSNLRAEELNWSRPDGVGPTHLISGITTQHDMMRGEETEIIGLMADSGLAALRQRSLLILPGTHSKHVSVENESVVEFRTFMTGELFEVLGRQSLLRASVNLEVRPETHSLPEMDRDAFQEGVMWAKEHGLPEGLFRVRTRAVLGGRPLAENTWFFSGLLIGAELAKIGERAGNGPVILAATGRLSELYALAMQAIAGHEIEWSRIPPAQMENAVIAAHALFLQNHF